MAVQNAVVFLNALVVLLFASSLGNGEDYSPKPDIGYPAGLIPNYPCGIFKDDGKRPDGITLVLWERIKALVWDTTSVDTLAASHLIKGTSFKARAASEAAELSPGVLKNATISSKKMQMFRIVIHKLANGKIHRRNYPITSAPKSLAKDKLVDLKNKKTVLYCGGFLDSAYFPFSQAIGTAYSKRGYNVMITETFQFLTYIYPKSVRLTKVLGDKIGEFLKKLTEQGLKVENLEIVGMSLGAHIAGYAAKYLYAATGKKPSRITGLDPAGPCYRALPPSSKLQASDADRIDIVHTNIDGFGLAEKLGHVDFYVNGGEYQPSDIPAIPCLVFCSHFRSAFYWWQAIEHPKKFIGVKCDSIQDARFAKCFNNSETNYLGLETKFNRTGIYYLPTFNEFPYYRGKEGLKQENEIYTSVSRFINAVDLFEV